MGFSRVAVVPLVAEHAGEVAFLWQQRNAATRRFAYDLAGLARLDQRLEANLDGLRVAREVGHAVAVAALDEEPEPGRAFVAAKLALDRGDMKAVAALLDRLEVSPELWPAWVSAIAFCPWSHVEKVLRALVLRTNPSPLVRMGIAGYGEHRRAAGAALSAALDSPDRTLRLTALEAVSALRLAAFVERLRERLGAADDREQLLAARALVLCGERSAVGTLQRLAEQSAGPEAEDAAALAGAASEPSAARSWIAALDARGQRRLALTAAATSGIGALLPWVVSCMQQPEHARLAGYAFYAITGLRIEDDLEGTSPEGLEPDDDVDELADDDVAVDPDDDLPWPNPTAIADRLGSVAHDEARRLLGKTADAAWLETLLREAPQPIRQLADWHRGWRQPGLPCFRLGAPSWDQRAQLGLGGGPAVS